MGGRVIKNEVTSWSDQERSTPGVSRCGFRHALLVLLLLMSGTIARGVQAQTDTVRPDTVKTKDGAKKADPATSAMDAYLARVRAQNLAAPASLGSTWSDTGRLSRLMSDVRAFQPHDLIDVLVTESIVSTANGSITGARTSASSSQITALLSLFSKSSSASNLLGQTSSNTLTGTAQSADTDTLTTTLGGTVVAVLPNGVLVIEAARQIHFSQETQTIILRGLVRPEDVSAQNQVISTAISDMEVQVVGKGIVEDYTHRPNFFVRALQSLLIF